MDESSGRNDGKRANDGWAILASYDAKISVNVAKSVENGSSLW